MGFRHRSIPPPKRGVQKLRSDSYSPSLGEMLERTRVFVHAMSYRGRFRPKAAVANRWSSALRGVVAQPRITPVSSAKTAPNTSGDVNGRSRDAIEALTTAVYMTD